jgi:hypothetical protein
MLTLPDRCYCCTSCCHCCDHDTVTVTISVTTASNTTAATVTRQSLPPVDTTAVILTRLTVATATTTTAATTITNATTFTAITAATATVLLQRFCLWEWLQDPGYSPPSPGRVIVSATASTEDAAVITPAAHLPLAEECLTLLCVLVSEMPALPGPAGAAQALRREVVHR